MRYNIYKGIMAGRVTVNVFLFAVSAVAAETAYNRRTVDNHVTFGRLSFGFNDVKSPTPDLLDTSQWLARETTSSPQIRIDGIEVPLLDDNGGKTTTLVASVRTRRRPSFRPQHTELEVEVEVIEVAPKVDPAVLKAVSKPFVPKAIWARLQGIEFDHPSVIEDFVETGLSMTASAGEGSSSSNEWVTWKAHNKETPSSTDMDVRVHVGRCSRGDADQYYGANLPMIRTEAIIQNIKPSEMAELLLDSSRVKVYNKMSIGRHDIRQIACEKGIAKIVKNLTQPPITSKKIESTTFMHARQLNAEGAYLVVSRAVSIPSVEGSNEGDDHGKSEILLGINLLEPCEGNRSSKLTSVTHVYSPSLPAMVATRVGVNSAINFVKDIRGICEEPADEAKKVSAN
jgi:hypothetical protein